MRENESKYGNFAIIGGGRNAGRTLKAHIDILQELEQYRAIGTVEEFKALKEKAKSKSRILKNGKYYCCSCNRFAKTSGYCSYCGQLLY